MEGYRCWSLSSAHLKTPVLFLPLMLVELKAETYICVRLSSSNLNAMTASDGISHPRVSRSGPTCVLVCILDMLFAPSLTARLGDIPKRISSPKNEYKQKTSSSANFTGRRDYLAILRAYFSIKLDEPLRRKSFLLYGIGGIGKTQICLKFTEENSHL